MGRQRLIKIIGLTGRSGAGKGYIADRFRALGIYVIDTDAVSREVTSAESDCLRELTKCFGSEILLSDGSLNRRKLATIAFSDPDKQKKLNYITHRHILGRTDELLLEHERASGDTYSIVDAPLLFESGYDCKCFSIIGVIADNETCIRRICRRDGIDREAAIRRLALQHTNDYFEQNCTYIIYNNGEDIESRVNEISEELKEKTAL